VAVAAAGALAIGGVGGAAAGLPTSGSAQVHTLRFTAFQTANHNLGKNRFVSTDVERRKGKVVGYDAVSGSFNSGTGIFTVNGAIAHRRGLLYVSATETEAGVLTGKITGGTGVYKGAKGTVEGQAITNKKIQIVVRYTL
jgi:hypothetical protein